MKKRDIEVGVPHRKHKASEWGVPVTTDRTYGFSSHTRQSKKYLNEGRGILVLVKNIYPITNAASATPESAAEALALIGVPSTGNTDALIDILKPLGLTIEVWLPQEIAGTVEQVRAKEELDADRDRRIRREQEDAKNRLNTQFENVQKDLGINIHAFFNVEKGKATMSINQWEKLMDRVESLLQSDPLGNGKL